MEVTVLVHRVDGTVVEERRVIESEDGQGLYHVERAATEDEVHDLRSRIPQIFQRPA